MWFAIYASVCFLPAQSTSDRPPLIQAVEYKLAAVDSGPPTQSMDERLKKYAEGLTTLGLEGWETVIVGDFLTPHTAAEQGRTQNVFKRPVAADRRSSWEYKVLDIGPVGLNRAFPPEPPGVRREALEKLARVNEDGWELVAAFFENDSLGMPRSQRYFLMKRTKRK